jgi:hypothetical protein
MRLGIGVFPLCHLAAVDTLVDALLLVVEPVLHRARGACAKAAPPHARPNANPAAQSGLKICAMSLSPNAK